MANFVLTYEAVDATVGIEVERPSSLVAPTQIWLRAVDHTGLAAFEEAGNVYDGAHHEYYHEWRINGDPLPAWSKPQNLLHEHNAPNTAFGREVAFCLPNPGHYVIDLTVTDRLGNTAVASTETLIVFDPESYFPPADRIYVDNTGVYSDVPADSGKVATLEDLRIAMDARTTNPTWVLLKRGQEHTLTGVNLAHQNDNYKGMLLFNNTTEVRLVSGYGTGGNPVITPDTRPDRATSKCMFYIRNPKSGGWRTISGIDFRGQYDPETEHGFGNYIAGAQSENWQVDDGFSLLHDINVSGLSCGFQPGGVEPGKTPSKAHHQLFVDCACDGWRDFAMFGGQPGQHLGVIGCRFVQKPNVPNKGSKDGVRNTHGPVRISNSDYVYFAMNDLFSRNHWDGHDQPCLRLFTQPYEGQAAIVERCSMEGGFEVIHLINSENDPIYPANIMLERLLLVSSSYTSALLNMQRSGVTLRDSLLIRTNVPMLAPAGNAGAINMVRTSDLEDEREGVYTNPVTIYSNTYVNLLDSTNDIGGVPPWPFVKFDPAYDNVIEENNIHHRPAGTLTVVDSAPINGLTAISGFTPRYRGLQLNFEYPSMVLTQDVPDGGALTWPYNTMGNGLYGGPAATMETDQAYWQAVPDTRHQINVGHLGGRRYHAETGHIEVNFSDPAHVSIINHTGLTWEAGVTVKLWLDRSSLMPAMDETYANPGSLPLPRPYGDSDAIATATAGRVSSRDFLLSDRGDTPSKGALEPAPGQ